MTRVQCLFAVLIPALLFIFGCVKEDDGGSTVEEYVVVGDQIPEFTLVDRDGALFSSRELAGKRSLIVFFVTTCKDCRRELPIVNQAYTRIADREDCTIIAIGRGQDYQVIEDYWAASGYTVPYLSDPVRSVYSMFANMTVPRLYAVNTSGVVTWMAVENLRGVDADKLVEIIINQD